MKLIFNIEHLATLVESQIRIFKQNCSGYHSLETIEQQVHFYLQSEL
jgi:hypothetical protein